MHGGGFRSAQTHVETCRCAHDRHRTLRHVTSPLSRRPAAWHTHSVQGGGRVSSPESPGTHVCSGTHTLTFVGPRTLTGVSKDTRIENTRPGVKENPSGIGGDSGSWHYR